MSKMMVLGGGAFGRGFIHEGGSYHEWNQIHENKLEQLSPLFSVLCGYNEKTAEERPRQNSSRVGTLISGLQSLEMWGIHFYYLEANQGYFNKIQQTDHVKLFHFVLNICVRDSGREWSRWFVYMMLVGNWTWVSHNAGLSLVWFNPWIGKIPWRREWPPTPVFLPGEFHGQRSLAGSWGRKSVRHNWATNTQTKKVVYLNILLFLHMSYIKEW